MQTLIFAALLISGAAAAYTLISLLQFAAAYDEDEEKEYSGLLTDD